MSTNNHLNGHHKHNGINNVTVNESVYSDQELDLTKFINLLMLHKWKLVFITLFFTTVAGILAYTQTPIFRSDATIIISESKNRYSYAGSDLSNLLTTTYGIGAGSTIANELQILSSRSLSFNLADSILNTRYLDDGSLFPILWREYDSDSTVIRQENVAGRLRNGLIFEKVSSSADIVRITFESPSPEEAAYIVNLTMNTYSQISTEQNRSAAVAALSFLTNELSRIENELLTSEERLKSYMDSTGIVQLNTQTTQLINLTSSLENEKQSVKVKLTTIEAGLSSYQNELESIKPGLADQFSKSVAPTLERLQYRKAELTTERLLILSRNPSIVEEKNSQLVDINRQIEVVETEIISLTNQILNSQSDYFLTLLSSSNNINNNSLFGRISEITSSLLELQIEEAQANAQLSALDIKINELENQFDNLPEKIIELSQIRRDVSINENLFDLVSNQYAEMSLWEKTQFGLGRPLDYGLVPRNPIYPKIPLWIAVGFLFGIIMAVGFVILRDSLSDIIRSTDDLSELSLPVLGAIPDFKLITELDPTENQLLENKYISNQLITFLDHISPMSEAYRRLRINVVYANPDKAYKVIMVTSATKGEGKSTVVSNLAVTFSEAEKSVLVIDLDLRRPTQHKIFGETREPGLTDSLFDTISLGDIIRSTIAPNVDLLTVGKKTPEPATVLDSKRLKQLIDKLKDRYDHIILDTAPYGIISDSASLLRLVDGLIVVSRFNRTTKRELSFTIDGLRHLNADILGLVLNAFNPEKSTDYYTNYSYYKRTYYSDYYKEEGK